ncbi:MAG TPA: glucose-1-phosphate cytidylyltransferase [Pirellulales bacterium]|nr:glucose-1-phosphate cytidylyltransferase [Pirellulales bacterium]
MKVVLFCGGLGMRLREYSEAVPKPMVPIGYRPILWHVMKYYAHFGHKDFILCLGWKADVVKNYFLKYDECLSNDFVLSSGGNVDLLNSDIHDWKITFCDTGTNSSIGQRLLAVERHLEGEETFLANYTDGLTDFPLPELIDFYYERQASASFLCVRPNQTFHTVRVDDDGRVENVESITSADVWMNGGYFVLGRDIFDLLRDGDDLVLEPFQRLIADRRLHALKYDGFWSCMDTYKEKQHLDDLYARGNAPWELWKRPAHSPAALDLATTVRPFGLGLPK